MLPGFAFAQGTDYSAGKTPAQLFAGDCSACHKTPRGLAKDRDARTLASFLREHYTSKVESAGALAVYLVGNPGSPVDSRKRQGTPATDGADTNIVVPEGDRRATREAAKPGDGQTSRVKGKKLTAAEAAREAAKLAEEAAKAKIQAYATAGEGARPLLSEAVSQPAEPEPKPPAENSAVEAAPAAETKPPAEDHPAATPPG